MSKVICFFEKTCHPCVVVGVAMLAVIVLLWMLYLLSSSGL
ncbi:MAG: hypothetical protein QNL62_01275 [Gammaproteobacteria bacterium]|nr:hypothetical protein [Gammaproteobacteria bacterium]